MHARIRGDKSCYISCRGKEQTTVPRCKCKKTSTKLCHCGAGSEDDMDKQYTNNYASAPVGEKWYDTGNKGSTSVRTGVYVGGVMDGVLKQEDASGVVYSAGTQGGFQH